MNERVAKKASGRRYIAVTLLACMLVVQPTSSRADPRELSFHDMPPDGNVVVATRGSDVVLDCQAIGMPNPTIHWLHRGRRLLQGDRHDVRDDTASYETEASDNLMRLGSTKSRLFIDCVRPSDSGVYTCVAEKSTKRITITIVLRVVSPTRKHLKRRIERGSRGLRRHIYENAITKGTSIHGEVSSDSCRNKRTRPEGEPARIFMWTSTRFAEMGQDVQLFCRASGSPQPTVTWLDPYQREIRPDNKNYKLLDNGDLVIHDIAWSDDMGLYYCKVQNNAGSDATDVFIYPTSLNR